MSDLNIEDLYNKITSPEQLKESFDKITARTGRYTFTATRVDPRKGESDAKFEPVRDREYASVFGKMTETMPDGTTKRRGSVGFDASWELKRDQRGAADKLSKLWGQIATALDMKDKSVGEIINALKQYPVSVYVNESFKTPEKWATARNQEEREAYRRLGYEARNFVESVSKITG